MQQQADFACHRDVRHLCVRLGLEKAKVSQIVASRLQIIYPYFHVYKALYYPHKSNEYIKNKMMVESKFSWINQIYHHE